MNSSSIPGDGFFNTTDLSWLYSWQMRPTFEGYWKVFFCKYLPYIKGRIAKFYLRPQDGDDLQQEIFAKILLKIHAVRRPHKGSFRAWLKTIVRNALCDWFEDAAKRRVIRTLDPEIVSEIAQETTDEIENDYYLELMRRAIIQVRFDLQPSTWEMFEQSKLLKKSAAEVAKAFGVSVLTVYDANRRVMERLREIIKSMDQMGEA